MAAKVAMAEDSPREADAEYHSPLAAYKKRKR